MEPSNIETPYGTFVYAQNYNSKEYWEWAKKQAIECIKAVSADDPEEDYLIWLDSRAKKSLVPDDFQKFNDLIIAKKMLLDGKSGLFFGGLWNTWQHLINASRQEEIEKQKPISIRGLDHALFFEARAQAIREGKNIGDWLNGVISDRLNKIKGD